MKEENIKSAFEIAMEKISDLPELTREEIEEQKKKEFEPVGDAVGKKYLSGTILDGELSLELARHSGSEQRIVRTACIARLCREIGLENDREIPLKALKGLKLLASEKGSAVEGAVNGFREIFNEFVEQKEGKRRQFEVLAMEKLSRLGISGSAVRPNLSEDSDWKEQLRKLRNHYEPRLADIRRRLRQELQQ